VNYEDLKNEALAAMSAGADEQTFGLSSHVGGEAQKALRDKYPKSAMVGRVLSYVPAMFVGSGEERLAVRGAEMAPGLLRKLLAHAPQELLNKGADRVARSVPVLAEKAGESTMKWLAKAAGRGAVSAVTAGTGNTLARKAVDAAVPGETGEQEKPLSDLPQDAAWQAGMGTIVGPLARILQKAAPAIYEHPALIKRFKEPQSIRTADQLRGEGVWGGKNVFKGRAQQMKEGIQTVTDDLMPKLRDREAAAANEVAGLAPHDPAMAAYEEIPMAGKISQKRLQNRIAQGSPGPEPIGLTSGNMGGHAEAAEDAMIGADQGKKAAMRQSFGDEESLIPTGEYGETNLGHVEDRLKETNQRVKKMLSDREKGRAFGDEGGQVAAERERLLAIQKAHNDTVEKAINRFGDTGDKEAYAGARGEYRQGADLEGAVNDYTNREAGDTPHVGHSLTRTVLNKTINTLPVRTGLGVLLDRLSPEVAGTIGGRAVDARQRSKLNQPKEQSPAELLKHYQDTGAGSPADAIEQDLGDEENPYLKNPTQDVKKTTGNPYLDAIGR
jgi:hypothetical protein